MMRSLLLLVLASLLLVSDAGAQSSSHRTSTPPGTAALPGLYFAGDRDTGVYRPGADQVGVTAGGAARLTVTTSGAAVTGTLSSTGNLSTSAGTLSAGGYEASEYLISTTAVSNAATVDVDFPTSPVFRHFRLVLEDVVPASASVYLRVRVKVAGAVQSGASDYSVCLRGGDSGGDKNFCDNAEAEIRLQATADLSNTEGEGGASFILHALHVFGTVQHKSFHWTASQPRAGNSNALATWIGTGKYQAADSALTGLQFSVSGGGNITKANISLYGIKG
jgi:hypothetical protein